MARTYRIINIFECHRTGDDGVPFKKINVEYCVKDGTQEGSTKTVEFTRKAAWNGIDADANAAIKAKEKIS